MIRDWSVTRSEMSRLKSLNRMAKAAFEEVHSCTPPVPW